MNRNLDCPVLTSYSTERDKSLKIETALVMGGTCERDLAQMSQSAVMVVESVQVGGYGHGMRG